MGTPTPPLSHQSWLNLLLRSQWHDKCSVANLPCDFFDKWPFQPAGHHPCVAPVDIPHPKLNPTSLPHCGPQCLKLAPQSSTKTKHQRLVSGGGHFWADILAPGPETKLALDKTDNCLPVWKNLKAGLLLDNWSKIVSRHLIGVIVDEDKALPVTKPTNTFYSFYVIKHGHDHCLYIEAPLINHTSIWILF